MANILDLFSPKTTLDYLRDREVQSYAIGEALFPEVKYPTLEFEYITGANDIPVVAKVHSFDTKGEIGSVEAAKVMLEAAYIKKLYQITEKDLVALAFPRTPVEQQQVQRRIFGLIDKAVADVRAAVELMRMQAVANGELNLQVYNGTGTPQTLNINYNVPANQKEVLAGANLWSDPTSDIIGDINRWSLALPMRPERALTSRRVLSYMLSHPRIVQFIYGSSGTGRIATEGDLNAALRAHGLPTIIAYENTNNSRYRVQAADGTYTTQSYFPENKFVLMPAVPLGNTLYGPTPDENKFIRDNVINEYSGNVIGYIFESGQDPIATWAKAATTAIPSLPEANNMFQATVIA